MLLYSQASTVKALMPLGLSLGLSPAYLIGIFPACNGHFFIPGYPTLLTAIQFDRTGTTRIGKYVLNHSFMLPGIVTTAASVLVGLLLQSVLL
jgi:anaerobic C4-dicarboxylate transporter DcuA